MELAWAFYDSTGALTSGVLGAWKFFDGSGVVIVPPIDHGSLIGLADDDHPQYVLHTEVDDAPVNGATTDPISSNWAFDHEAAADPHTGYRLESADHSHQSTGLQAGQIDHGAALTGLADDDHTQYQLRSEEDAASGYAGLNSASRITKGAITTDDLIVDLATKGLVLKDTQGSPHYWRVTIDNTGALVTSDLGTSAP